MIVFRPIYWIGLLLVILNCSPFLKKNKSNNETSIHLMLNSTGLATEFCIFEIEKTQNLECVSPKPVSSYAKCVEYFPENTKTATITSKETLDQIYKGLAELELSRPALKQSIKNVAYLATGTLSFSPKAETKQIFKDVESHFTSQDIKITTKQISGEEEARYTAIAIEESNELEKTPQKEIALLQIGPDTVEIISSISGKNSKVFSSKIGIQSMLEELTNIKPGINTCRQPISAFFKSEASSFEKCKEFIKENLNKSNRLNTISKLELGDKDTVFTTGSTWGHYFPKKDSITIEELNIEGNNYCSLTIDDILKKGIKKRNAYNLCYSLAYKAAIAEILGIKKLNFLKKDVYLKNLSVSKILFPDICR